MGLRKEYQDYLDYLREHDPMEGQPIRFDEWLINRGAIIEPIILNPLDVWYLREIMEGKEDQDLISAAPALLEAAKRAMDIINSYSHIPALFVAFNTLRDAVNKAEGSPCE